MNALINMPNQPKASNIKVLAGAKYFSKSATKNILPRILIKEDRVEIKKGELRPSR
jgi:hypothetical protein